MMKILVTGGAGFIGSALIKQWLHEDPRVEIVNFDKLTYSGDLWRLKSIENNPRYRFFKGDVARPEDVDKAIEGCTGVIHAAAETHVDRSLLDSRTFLETNIYGTQVLLEAARKKSVKRFLLVSTDEVYGSRDTTGSFKETDRLSPSSPYSVSKASADLLTFSYAHTHGMDALVTRGSNTYGSFQYPEKVIPLFVTNALSNQSLPLYGDGKQIRNWLHVEDHARAIRHVFRKGKKGEAYNIASKVSLTNIDLTRRLLKILNKPDSLIKRVTDRLGHDRRYAIDSSKLRALGWKEKFVFDEAFLHTVLWYRDNEKWWKAIKEKSAEFRRYYDLAYTSRLKKRR